MDIRLRVHTHGGGWRAVLRTDQDQQSERSTVVGVFSTWKQALDEGCVAGRLQAAGISWGMPSSDLEPEHLQPGEWGEVSGDGTGEALPPMPDDAYPAGAVALEELPMDAVGRSLQPDPAAMTYSEGRRDLSPDVVAYLDTLQRGGSMYGGRP